MSTNPTSGRAMLLALDGHLRQSFHCQRGSRERERGGEEKEGLYGTSSLYGSTEAQ